MPIREICSKKIVDIQPLRCYSELVFEKYPTIKELLSSKISEDFSNFLLEPSISKEALEGVDEALYFSHKYKNLKPFTHFDKKSQKEIIGELNRKVNQILTLSNQLLNSENREERRLGEFLKSTIEVPSLDYVYSNGKDVALAFWGFKSVNVKYRDFKLSKAIEELNEEEPPQKIQEKIIKKEEEKAKPKRDYKKLFLTLLGLFILTLLALLGTYLYKNLYKNGGGEMIKKIDPNKIKIDKESPIREKIITNRIMVILKEGEDIEKFIKKIKKSYPNIELITSFKELGVIEYQIKDENRRKEWISIFKNLPEVKEAQSERILSTYYIPNDSGFIDKEKRWFFKEIEAFKGWDITKGKKEVVVAVLDNYFDINHPEIRDNIISYWNASNGTNRLSIPTNPHGTHVASLIAGKIDNHLGTSGICPNCSLLTIQLASGTFRGFSTTALIRGFIYAVQNRVDVINLSLGLSINLDFSKMSLEEKKTLLSSFKKSYKLEEILWNRLYRYAVSNNIVVVEASGNSDMFSDIDPMKRSDLIINVSAVNPSLKRASFSNFGSTVSVSAPGVKIYSAVPNGEFAFLQGTSMASPIVAGLAGLLKSQNRGYSPQFIKEIIIKSGKKLSYSKEYIGPLIQIEKALKESSKYNREEELERVKRELKKCQESKNSTRFIIPKIKPKSFEFAEGLWKSTTDLFEYNNITKKILLDKPIKLFFDINKNGKGKIKLKKFNGLLCEGDINLSFNRDRLDIKQTTIAICKDGQTFTKYNFYCQADSNGVAICRAEGNNNFKFELEKIEKERSEN